MKINYSSPSIKMNLIKFIFSTLIYILILFAGKSYSQCAVPTVGCPGTDLSNFGVDSDNNPATIEYDNYVSSYHSTVARTTTGSFTVWGEYMANDGTANLETPQTLNVVNYPALTGTPLKVAMGSFGSLTRQGIVLTTTGLFAWGVEGQVLDNAITTSNTFQKITINTQTNGLPAGVIPADVKMMFATFNTLAITLCNGNLWVLSLNVNNRGVGAAGGSSTIWNQPTTDTVGNPVLTNVIACRGTANGLIALRSDNTVYVWGTTAYIANGTAAIANQTRATLLSLPTFSGAGKVKLIGATSSNNTNISYYILSTDGKLYAVGANDLRQLGDFTTTLRLSWVQPSYPDAVTPANAGLPMNNIKWMSPNEHDPRYPFVNVVNSAKKLFAFGSNNTSAIGASVDPSNPVQPNGIVAADQILMAESGGHTSMIIKSCAPNFGYVGHRFRGSMGVITGGAGNPADNVTEPSYTFVTAPIQVCGAESLITINPVSLTGQPIVNNCIGQPITLEATPIGGTLTVVSGPGTIAGNTLNFTGLGSVVVQYAIALPCGGNNVSTKTFVTQFCANDVSVVKTINNNTPIAGNTVVFSIGVANPGASASNTVVATDILPSGYTYVSHTAPAGTTYVPATGLWTIGNMTAGQSTTLTITATVNSSGNYTNQATVSTASPDPNLSNNISLLTPNINLPKFTCSEKLYITRQVSPNSVCRNISC